MSTMMMEHNENEVDKIERPIIEKKLGDIKNQAREFEEACNHYKNAIMALKILFDEEGLLNESKATELIEEIGVYMI
jgi:hypothetical protein